MDMEAFSARTMASPQCTRYIKAIFCWASYIYILMNIVSIVPALHYFMPSNLCCQQNLRIIIGSSPLRWWFKSRCMWEEPGQPCHIHDYTVYTHIGGKGRCRTRGESEESVVHRRGSTQARESTLALKLRADVTRSPKQGYQWPHEKDMCPTKIF